MADSYVHTFEEVSYQMFGIKPINNKVAKLIKLSKLSVENLVIALNLIHKFLKNSVIRITEHKLIQKLVILSLILSNKIYNDQNYTFKTWLNLIEVVRIPNIDLKVLKQLEIFFLSCIDYKLDYKHMMNDSKFWNHLSQTLPESKDIFHTYLASGISQEPDTSNYNTPVMAPITPQDTPAIYNCHVSEGCFATLNAPIMQQELIVPTSNFTFTNPHETKRIKFGHFTPNDYDIAPALTLHEYCI